MNTKIALSAMSVFSALALMGGATYAFFTDVETSTGNTFTSGTLDLKVNGEDNPSNLVNLTAKPSEFLEPFTITLENVGSNGGVADLHFVTVQDSDDTETEPECVAEGGTWDGDSCTGGTPVDNVSSKIGIDIGYDLDDNGTVDQDEYLIWTNINSDGNIDPGELSWGDNPDLNNVVATLDKLATVGFDLGPLPGTNGGGGTPRELILSFHLDSSTANEYQGDMSSFGIEFTLHQQNDNTSNNIVPLTPTPIP